MKNIILSKIYTIYKLFFVLYIVAYLNTVVQANNKLFPKQKYIAPGTGKFFQSSSYGVSRQQQNLSQNISDKWSFTTSSKFILKHTFIYVDINPRIHSEFEPCSNGIFVYDGSEIDRLFLLAEICDTEWKIQPITFSSSNVSTILFSQSSKEHFGGGFLAYVESVSDSFLSLPSILCNTSVRLANSSVYLFPTSFPSLHSQSLDCYYLVKILDQEHEDVFGEISLLSLKYFYKLFLPKQQNCVHCGFARENNTFTNGLTLEYIPKEKHHSSNFVTARFCGFSPIKSPILFQRELTVRFVPDRQDVNQGFFALIKLMYCLNEMEYDEIYCSTVFTVSCQMVQTITEIFQPSCHNYCKCPSSKPIWQMDRCVSPDECTKEFSAEIHVPSNEGSHEAGEKRRKREVGPPGRSFDSLAMPSASFPDSKIVRRQRRSTVHSLCGDISQKQGYCSLSRAMGHCIRQSVVDECRHTCGFCAYAESWSDWSAWSSCTRDCSGGKRMRIKSCINCGTTKIDVEECPTSRCTPSEIKKSGRISSDLEERKKIFTIKPRAYNDEGFGLEKDNKEFKCGANGFACETYNHCIKDTQVCNGYYECTDQSDEPGSCPLGFRFDGTFVIQNWATHKCVDVRYENDPSGLGSTAIPWAFTRCPGQQSPELKRYWWRYMIGRRIRLRGLLRNEHSGLCLTLNVTRPSGRVTLKVLMTSCDFSYRNRFQLWDCEPYSYRIRVTFPRSVLPEGYRRIRYLSLSKKGPGQHLNMTDRISEDTTDFNMLETDRKAICSGRAVPWPYIPRSTCSKSCGNGTKQILRECARHGKMDCNDGKRYKAIPCNTQPCFEPCPPGFSVMESDHNEQDINCFRVFKERRSFGDAQLFCAARNWSLAADKNKQTHEHILKLLLGTRKSYIGAYEDLSKSADEPPGHAVRYDHDDQPVGGFHPWQHYGKKDNEDLPGCVMGRGGSYHGAVSSYEKESNCAEWPTKPGLYHPLKQLEAPYFDATNGTNYCRNPSLDPKGPWCYTKDSGVKFCNITNCFDTTSVDGSTRVFPNVDLQHKFAIRSRHGEYWQRKWCLSAINLNPDFPGFARPWPCNTDDELQQFYWWSSTSLVNVGTKECLSLETGPPKHGDRLVFKPCNRRLAHTYQAFKADGSYFFPGWRTDAGVLKTQQNLLKLVYDPRKFTATLHDMRMDLFALHSKTLGMVRGSTLLGKTPAGPYVLLRGCGSCITHDIQKGFDLIRSAPCSQQHAAQRWIVLDEGRLMNAESGRCLASFAMRAYAIMRRCDKGDPTQYWNWKPSINENLTKDETTKMKHRETRSFLRCSCDGLSSICLTSTSASINTTFSFIPGPVKSTAFGRAADKRRASVRGILGYPFFIQNSANLTKCAKPRLSSEEWEEGGRRGALMKIIFFPCRLEDSGFLWWFSGIVTQIKHRNLDLCLDANTDLQKYEKEEYFGEQGVRLRPCSLARLDLQSWVFSAGPTPRDPNELPGDYIRLAVDQRYYLSIRTFRRGQLDVNEEDFLLVMRREDNTDKWDALTMLHNAIHISEMIDCALPWTKMGDYRGTRSWTRYGIRCQPWKSQVPHRHPFVPMTHPAFDLVENRCRKPPGDPVIIMDRKYEDHAYCMTLDPEIPWQDCLVSRCPVPGVIVIDATTKTWETSLGTDRLPFTCQVVGECYYGVGFTFHGYTNWTGRGFCLNWRKYYKGHNKWPDHSHCQNPTNSFMKPWCWVKVDVPQYCDTLTPCVTRCLSPLSKLRRMKIVSISYTSPSGLYAVGSRIQLVCMQGYNITLANGTKEQTITCMPDGTWKPHLHQCRKIFCPPPMKVRHTQLLTTKSRYVYGSTVAYQCKLGHMVSPGRVVMEVKCLKSGEWSRLPHECIPSCPFGWVSFNFTCYVARSHYQNWVSFDEAQQICKGEGGHLAIPKNKVAYNLIKYLTQKSLGFSSYLYWVGVEDVLASKRYMADRHWQGLGNITKMYLDTVENFHQFKIRYYGSTLRRDFRYIFTDRCWYGDPKTFKIILKSCSFEEDETGMLWTWLTHDHLYNIAAGLCVAVDEYRRLLGGRGIQRGSVRLEQCDFESNRQSFTCGPHLAYLLKSRTDPGGYLTIEENVKSNEVQVGGWYRSNALSLWHTFSSHKPLCHWEVKPPDSYFVVHRGVIPTRGSFTQYEPHKCLENRTGARLANQSEVAADAFATQRLSWCHCLFMRDDQNKIISVLLAQDEPCAIPQNLGSKTIRRESMFVCETEEKGDSLCTRDDGSSPSVQPIPRWCLAMSVPDAYTHHLKARFCYDRLPGYVCEVDAKWTCKQPFLPRNAVPMFEGSLHNMKLAYGSEIDLVCKPGYRFPGVYQTRSITCNRYLKWELTKRHSRDDILTYVDDRRERERAIFNLRCYIVNCTAPPDVPGFVWEVQRMERLTSDKRESELYEYGSNVTYTCLNGTTFSTGLNTHVATCSQEQTWQPPLRQDKQCKTIECASPPALPLSNLVVPYLAYDSPANYTCAPGFWFRKNSFSLISKCNESGLWEPDPTRERCTPVTCIAPNGLDLDRIKARLIPDQSMITVSSSVVIMCLDGYWLDRGRHSVDLKCASNGEWTPLSPDHLQCVPVYCELPPQVHGAVMWGSDNKAGDNIRYECGPLNWVRRAFKLFSPHWQLCVRVVGGMDPEFYEPLNPPREDAQPFSAALQPSCDGGADLRDLWAWHWTFHLRNRYTSQCLTATAIPNLIEDIAPVTVAECDPANIFQQWTCANVPDKSNARLLSLRMAKRGAFLTTHADEELFWSGKDTAYLVVTGDKIGTDVKSFWQVYKTSSGSDIDVCTLREGHMREEVVCNNHGNWLPNPRHIECTLVDCGQPPNVTHSDLRIKEGNVTALSSLHFSAPNIWDHIGASVENRSAYPVLTVATYQCHVGRWIKKGQLAGSVVCRENGIWQNADTGAYYTDPQVPEVVHMCGEVYCSHPKILPHSMARVYPSTSVKRVDGEPVLPYRNAITYTFGVNVSYLPAYNSRLIAHCNDGFWVLKADLQDIPDEVKGFRTPGTPIIRSTCGADGSWSEPIVQSGIECVPLTCSDPGEIKNSRRIPNTKLSSYGYATIFQFQCNVGFWFSPARTYTESMCNKYGVWEPDPSAIACVKAKCRNPGPVPYAYRIGDDFTVGSKVTFVCSTGRLIARALKSKEIVCMLDGFWFPPPFSIRCELLICDPLPKIPHSTFVNASQMLTDVFLSGDHTMLHCDVGYTIDTMTTSVQYTCNYDGQWVPDENLRPAGILRCEPVHCNAPPDELPSGAILHDSLQSYKHKDLARYSCKPGQWIAPDGHIVAKEVTCVVTRNLASTITSGRHLPYVWKWVPDFDEIKCIDLECPHPGVLEKAYLDLSGMTYLSTATFDCETGYRMNIPRSSHFTTRFISVCGHDGRWNPDSSIVSCVPVECSDPGFIPNSIRIRDSRPQPPYYYNDTVEYKCVHGRYFIQLDALASSIPGKLSWKVTCLFDGTWELLPADYFVSCELVQCPAPKFIPQAVIATNYITPSGPAAVYPIDAIYNITCRPGYVNSLYGMKHSSLRCSETGKWDPADPFLLSCERVHCHDPGLQLNATRYITGFRLHDRIAYHAFPGYASSAIPPGKPRRIVTMECSITGQWRVLDAGNISLEGDPSLLASGSYPVLSRKKRRANSYPEEFLDFIPATCGPPQVSANVTPPLIVINATTTPVTNQTVWPVGSLLVLDCKPHYFIASNLSNTTTLCTDLGDWWPTPTHVRCFHMADFYCDLPKPWSNNTIQLTSYKMGETALVTCFPGFEMRPGITEQKIQCRHDGIWIPNIDLSCSEINCNPPPPLSNSDHNYTGQSYGSLATYKCKHGFSLTGLANETTFSIVCVHSNTWTPNPSLKSCVPIDCGSPAGMSIPNAGYAQFNTTIYGSEVTFDCDEGFHVALLPNTSKKQITAYCGIEGQWRLDSIDRTTLSENLQHCAAVVCGEPPEVNNTYAPILVGGMFYRGTAHYRCQMGYRTLPPGSTSNNRTFTMTCGNDGNWTSALSPNTYSCVKVNCPVVTAPALATITPAVTSPNTRELGSKTSYLCNSGFATLYGNNVTLECMWYGDWAPVGSLLDCQSLQCPVPSTILFSTGNGSRNVGGSWTYYCHANFEIDHVRTSISTVCNADGKWVPDTTNLEKCRLKACRPQPHPANTEAFKADGTKVDVSDPNSYIPASTTLNFICRPGFWNTVTKTLDPQPTFCEKTKDFTPLISTLAGCSPVSCSPPPTVANADITGITGAASYPFQHEVIYSCRGVNFFKTERKKTVVSKCSKTGTFDPSPVLLNCVPTKCENYTMAFGYRTQITKLDFEGEATYSCKLGAWFTKDVFKKSYVCSADGIWEPNIYKEQCVPASCNPPTIAFAKPVTTSIHYGKDVSIICEDGYYLSGAVKISCSDVGELVPPETAFTCKILICVKPKLPPNTEIGNATYYYGDPLVVRCAPGFWITPDVFSVTATCLKTGQWSSNIGKILCVPLSCPTPLVPRNGHLLGDDNHYKAEVRTRCNPGYWVLVEQEDIVIHVCDKQGYWDPTVPESCTKVKCVEPPPLQHASLSRGGDDFESPAVYTCVSLQWIALNNKTYWVLTGKKKVTTLCRQSGRWTPEPNTDFRCLSIYDGDVPIALSGQLPRRKTGRNFQDGIGPPYRTLVTSLKADWLVYNNATMTLSDSYVPTGAERERTFRDVRFSWDGNPLTFWVAATDRINPKYQWSIEIYLGKPKAVFGLMMMCPDDGRSDITSFSVLFAGRDKRTKTVGPFRVYGDRGIGGTPHANFPLDFSSIATPWIFGGFAEEMLWMHFIIHGTLDPYSRAGVREIGIYASEAEWEWSYPVDPLPAIILSSVFVAALAIVGSIMYYFDQRSTRTVLYTPPMAEKDAEKIPYKINFCVQFDKKPIRYQNMLIRIKTSSRSRYPVSWLRGNNHLHLFNKKLNYCTIMTRSNQLIEAETPHVELNAWVVVDDPRVGYIRNDDCSDYKIKISEVSVTNQRTGQEWQSTAKHRTTRYLKREIPYSLSVCFRTVLSIPLYKVEHCLYYDAFFVKLLRCHNFVAMVLPPHNSRMNRLERFLASMLYLVAGVVIAISFQIYFEAFPATDIAPNIELFSTKEEQVSRDNLYIFGGDYAYITLTFLSSLICIPITPVIRYLYALAKYLAERREVNENMLYEFCSHRVFFHLAMLRIPFMKTLNKPLATLLGVVLKDTPTSDAATAIPPELVCSDLFLTDEKLKRRWSDPEMAHIAKLLDKLQEGQQSTTGKPFARTFTSTPIHDICKDDNVCHGPHWRTSQWRIPNVIPDAEFMGMHTRPNTNELNKKIIPDHITEDKMQKLFLPQKSRSTPGGEQESTICKNSTIDANSFYSQHLYINDPPNIYSRERRFPINRNVKFGSSYPSAGKEILSSNQLANSKDDEAIIVREDDGQLSAMLSSTSVIEPSTSKSRKKTVSFHDIKLVSSRQPPTVAGPSPTDSTEDRAILQGMFCDPSESGIPDASADASFENEKDRDVIEQSDSYFTSPSSLSSKENIKSPTVSFGEDKRSLSHSKSQVEPINLGEKIMKKEDICLDESPAVCSEFTIENELQSYFNNRRDIGHTVREHSATCERSVSLLFSSLNVDELGDRDLTSSVSTLVKKEYCLSENIHQDDQFYDPGHRDKNQTVVSVYSKGSTLTPSVTDEVGSSTSVPDTRSTQGSAITVTNVEQPDDSFVISFDTSSSAGKVTGQSRDTPAMVFAAWAKNKLQSLFRPIKLEADAIESKVLTPSAGFFDFLRSRGSYASVYTDEEVTGMSKKDRQQKKGFDDDSDSSDDNSSENDKKAKPKPTKKDPNKPQTGVCRGSYDPTAPRCKVEEKKTTSTERFITGIESDCYGDRRLHHAVVTHTEYRAKMCSAAFSLRTILSSLITAAIIILCINLFFLGQKLGSNGVEEVYVTTALSFLFTIIIVMLVDSAVAIFAFKELG